MSWIKDFRLRYGLSQSQLGVFAGISRSYLSMLEAREEIPSALMILFTALEKEFKKAAAEPSIEPLPAHPTRHEKNLSALLKRIQKKETYVKKLEKRLEEREDRFQKMAVITKVCYRWQEQKKDEDPIIHEKIGTILADQDLELIYCGPEARSILRVAIGRIRSEIRVAQEEYENLFQNPHPNPPSPPTP